jgi:flagellar capping protein FliD
LLKAYYAKSSDSSTSTSTSSTKKTTSTTDTATQKVNAASVRDSASELVDSSTALKSSTLWSTTTKTDDDGKTTKEYDTDKIYSAVKSFVDDYNSVVKSASDSSSKSVQSALSGMETYSKTNSKLLAKVGISVNSDNTLSIDEKTFKSSSMTEAKSLFAGNGSYAQSVSSRASSMYGSAVSQLAQLNSSTTYSSSGSYSYISQAAYNQYL